MDVPTEPTPEKEHPAWVVPFLKHFAANGNVTAAAKRAKVNRQYVYEYRDANPDFAAVWKAAEAESVEVMEAEAHRRAVKGTLRPVYQQGLKVGEVREFSDTLLIFLLKARRPDVYRENSRVVHAGDAENPVRVKGEHEHRVSLTADDVGLARSLLGGEGAGVHPDGGLPPG